jgi:hypothetical protein
MRSTQARRTPTLTLLVIVALTFGCSASEEDCAKGTKLSKGVCVGDAPAAPGNPAVEELTVKYLSIKEEGQRPVYVMHPMTVHLGIEVRGEPFKSDVVIGLSSADGSKHCAAGYIELVFDGGADAGVKAGSAEAHYDGAAPVQSNRGVLTIEETLFVQPTCDKLAGEKNATIWVAIDPFRRLAFAADKRLADAPQPAGIDEVDAFLHASRWPLDQCKSSHQAGHPDNCKSVFEVAATPGLDVHLRRVQPSSSVLTLRADEDKEKTLRDAHLFANITTVLYGQAFKKIKKKNPDNPLAQYEMDFFFMLRPDVDHGDLPAGVSATDVDWEPLVQVEKGTVKAENGYPIMQELFQQYLASLETAVRRQLDQPLRLPDALWQRLTVGNWRRFSKFQMLGCAMPRQCSDDGSGSRDCASWKEASAKGVGAVNNCKTTTLIVARHQHAAKPLGGHHKKYEVDKRAGDDPVTLKWDPDPNADVNKCGPPELEVRPRCVVLGEHLQERKCYQIPDFKVAPLEGTCHCCYPANAFDPHLSWQHEPETGFTLGSNTSIGIRTRIWWTMHLHNKSLFEPDPLRLRTTVGFDATLVGWWQRSLIYVDTPIQLGIQPGQQSYWWPELGVLGFTLWDQKYTIDDDDAVFEVQALAAKEWTQNFCQTFCVQIVCFDVCAQVGASVALKPGVTILEKEKSVKGQLRPIAAAIVGGSVGLNLFLGVVGVKIVFQKFIAFSTPVQLVAQFFAKNSNGQTGVQIKGKAEYNLELDVLKGTISGFWTPKWGGGDQELDLYEWDGLLYVWSLWTKQNTWSLDF